MSRMRALAERMVALKDEEEELTRRAALVPRGSARDEIKAEANACSCKADLASWQLKLAEAYRYYLECGKWKGAPYEPTKAERDALRAYKDTPLHPVDVAHNVTRQLCDPADVPAK